MPLPSYGFDPTESSIPWTALKEQGHQVVFATPHGKVAQADRRMLTGEGLGLWKKVLMADAVAIQAYRQMELSTEFQHPISYEDFDFNQYDALLLTGGHDKGMREYLESPLLQELVVHFFEASKPVGAICHGTLLAARSTSETTGRSALWGRKTTALTQKQEMVAYYMTRLYLDDYYRTYNIPMEVELRSYLEKDSDYFSGPGLVIPLRRDSPEHLERGFTVLDNNYLSARWPGDAHRFASEFVELLQKSSN